MTKTLRDAAVALGRAQGAEAERIRGRARELGSRPDYPMPVDKAELAANHRALGNALVATLVDLDVLQRAGDEAADRALNIVRAHWGPRYVRDVETMLVGAGRSGRVRFTVLRWRRTSAHSGQSAPAGEFGAPQHGGHRGDSPSGGRDLTVAARIATFEAAGDDARGTRGPPLRSG